MEKTKLLYYLTFFTFIFIIISCGGAKVKVRNDSIRNISDVYFLTREQAKGPCFKGIIAPGTETEYREIDEALYTVTFLVYYPDLDIWLGWDLLFMVEEGGFLAGDKEYTFTVDNDLLGE